ncbi:hypothetical protein Tco_1481967 [Tanacetum coccineum]
MKAACATWQVLSIAELETSGVFCIDKLGLVFGGVVIEEKGGEFVKREDWQIGVERKRSTLSRLHPYDDDWLTSGGEMGGDDGMEMMMWWGWCLLWWGGDDGGNRVAMAARGSAGEARGGDQKSPPEKFSGGGGGAGAAVVVAAGNGEREKMRCHEKEDELVVVVVKVAHECRHWMGNRGESFWEGGDDFGVDVLRFHTCLTDILSFLEKFGWWFEQDIGGESEDDKEK